MTAPKHTEYLRGEASRITAIAFYDTGRRQELVLEEGTRLAFAAQFGPHQALADELRRETDAERVIVRCMGSFVAKSERNEDDPD